MFQANIRFTVNTTCVCTLQSPTCRDSPIYTANMITFTNECNTIYLSGADAGLFKGGGTKNEKNCASKRGRNFLAMPIYKYNNYFLD